MCTLQVCPYLVRAIRTRLPNVRAMVDTRLDLSVSSHYRMLVIRVSPGLQRSHSAHWCSRAARPFTEFGGDLLQRLSPETKMLMVDAGICHFMVVVKQPSQRLIMFDFGPVGGDVHVGGLTESPQSHSAAVTATATALNSTAAEAFSGPTKLEDSADRKKRRSKAVQGEIRISEV